MRALQTNLPAIPSSVFIGKDRQSILFVKHGNNNFIDYQQGQDMVAWTKGFLCIGEKEYSYNSWHKFDDNLKGYFKELLRDSLENI